MAQNNDINIKINVDSSQAEKSTVNYRQRVRELKDEMTKLQLAGKENTAEYAAAAQELGKITDAMADTSAQARILSDDFFKQRAAMEGLSVGVNIFSGLTQAAALCGGENEDLQKILVKLQAAQNLANVAMNIAKALNKDTALMTALRTKATSASTKELGKETTALGTGTVAMGAYTTGEAAATTGAITLKGAVKAVGTAIKSVPIIGWILAAVSAIVTLISYISDANDEEERGNEILEERKQKIQEINDNYVKTVQSIREENAELSKLMANLDNGSGQLYEDATEAVASYVGVSKEYIRSLTTEQARDLKNLVLWYKETSASVEKLKKELDEGVYSPGTTAFQEAQQKLWAGQATIRSYEKSINEEREKGYNWVKNTEAAAKALEEAEKARAKRIEETRKELEELNDVLYPKDEEEQITDKYDRLLDLAIKYYGEESRQVEEITRLRTDALDQLAIARQKANEQALQENEEARRLEEEATLEALKKAEKIRLEIIRDGTAEGSAERLKAQLELNMQLANMEISEAEREIQNTELLEQTKAQIIQKYALENAKVQSEYNLAVLEDYRSKIDLMGSIAGQFSNLVTSLQDAELEDAKDNEAEQARIKKKYARMNFLAQVASIGIDTAKGIMSVWSTAGQLGPIAGPIAAGIQTALIAATGAAQTAAANTAMNKALRGYAARGAFVKGRSHAEGGELYELEGGEAVLNKQAMAVPAFRALASAMNESTGGVAFDNISSSASPASNSLISANVSEGAVRRIVQDTISGILSIPVVVTEAAITEAQRNVNVTNSRSRF